MGVSYPTLCEEVKHEIIKIQNAKSEDRKNLENIVWTRDHEVRNIKVIWGGSTSLGSWDENGAVVKDTVITDNNCVDTLAALKERKFADMMLVTIWPKSVFDW